MRGNSPWTPSGASLGERIRAHLKLVIGLAVAAGVLLLAAVAGCCISARRRKAQGQRVAFFRVQQPYQALHEPAPEAYDMHAVPGQQQQGQAYPYQPYQAPGQPPPGPPGQYQQQQGPPGYHPGYGNPWDARY